MYTGEVPYYGWAFYRVGLACFLGLMSNQYTGCLKRWWRESLVNFIADTWFQEGTISFRWGIFKSGMMHFVNPDLISTIIVHFNQHSCGETLDTSAPPNKQSWINRPLPQIVFAKSLVNQWERVSRDPRKLWWWIENRSQCYGTISITLFLVPVYKVIHWYSLSKMDDAFIFTSNTT
jgi:hypothetical protein